MMLMMLAASGLPSTPSLGLKEGRCLSGNRGSAYIVEVVGLKDRSGSLKLELYPAREGDFLEDDNILVSQGKAFARVRQPVPKSGAVQLCIRAPRPGTYSLALLHDRDDDRKFGLSKDGIGFPNNPKLGLSKPKAAAASARVGSSPTRIRIELNYRRGLFSFGPVAEAK